MVRTYPIKIKLAHESIPQINNVLFKDHDPYPEMEMGYVYNGVECRVQFKSADLPFKTAQIVLYDYESVMWRPDNILQIVRWKD